MPPLKGSICWIECIHGPRAAIRTSRSYIQTGPVKGSRGNIASTLWTIIGCGNRGFPGYTRGQIILSEGVEVAILIHGTNIIGPIG